MEQFFSSLFDFSFKRFITPSIIRILYILCIVGSAATAITMILGGFRTGPIGGVAALVIAPFVFILSVCASRVMLEVILNIFRIANYSAEVARSTRRRPSSRTRSGTKTKKPRTQMDEFGEF